MSDSATDLSSPPYVGPRSFTAEETLYGREREAGELRSLLISERIVLLYSPSGAGKTSLLNAKVIPALVERQFAVQPVLRVSLGTPEGGGNRYLNSLALSLQPQAPGGAATPAGLPPGSSLVEFLDARPSASNPGGEVLIFDQFEEILTLDPTDIPAKEQFFREVGAALRRPHRWALFSMREDYVAGLDPYLRYLPTRLSCTFRLDLLGLDGAAEAISKPAAKQRGVTVDPEVVKDLVHNLSLVQVQQADGASAQVAGPYVEPVQLQVVCLRMWDSWLRTRKPDSLTIGPGDVDAVASVGDALEAYYDQRVREVAAEGAASPTLERAREREIREWFSSHLITPGGIRGQVLKGFERTEGLTNAIIRELVDAYLVRSERRGGRTWYELAHDRLIDPVRASNEAWFEDNLALAQKRATLWESGGRPEGLLLRGAELRAANAWSRGADVYVTELEREYLAACQRLARARAILQGLMAAVAVLAVVATIAAFRAVIARNEATARLLASQAAQALAESPPRSLLLAVEAVDRTAPLPPLPEAVTALYGALAASGGTPLVHTDGSLISVDAAGPVVAAGGTTGEVYLWRDVAASAPPERLIGHGEGVFVNDLDLSADGRLLATAGDDGLLLWDLSVDAPTPQRLGEPDTLIAAVALSDDGRALAAADANGALTLWDTAAPSAPQTLSPALASQATVLAMTPDGARLAAGDDSGTLLVWELASPSAEAAAYAQPAALAALAFGSDGRTIATGGEDGLVHLIDASGEQRVVGRLNAPVRAVALSVNGALLAAGDASGQILVWDRAALAAASEGTVPPIAALSDHRDAVDSLRFIEDDATLLSTSNDKTVHLRPTAELTQAPIVARGHEGVIDEERVPGSLVTVSADGTLRRWDLATLGPVPWLRQHTDEILAVQFSPDGATLLTGDRGGRLLSRPAADPGAPEELLAVGDVSRMALTPDGRYLAASVDTTLRLWDRQSGGEPRLLIEDQEASTLVFSPDGATLAVITEEGQVLFFPTAGATTPATLPPQGDSFVSALAFSPDGGAIAIGTSEGRVQTWPFPALGKPTTDLDGHERGVSALAFSPDGRTLASGDRAGTIRLWRDGGRAALTDALLGHEDQIVDLAISFDGRRLASASGDGTARLWDLRQPERIPQILDGHGRNLRSLALSSDGRMLATADDLGFVRLWPADLSALRELACATAGRNLRRDEWAQYFPDTPYDRTCPALPGPQAEDT